MINLPGDFNLPNHVVVIVVVIAAIIPALAIWSWFELRKAHKRLYVEEVYLENAKGALQDVTLDAISAERNPVEWVLTRCGLTDEDGRNSVVGQRILRMGRLSRTQIVGDQLLADILIRSEDLHPRLARFLGSIMVFVALVGTVFTLGIAVCTVPRFGEQSPNLLPLNNILTHIPLAFFITGWGIFWTLIVALMNHLFDSRQDKFLLDVEEFSVDVLAPLLLCQPFVADISRVESLQHELVETTRGLRTVVEEVGKSLHESIAETRAAAEHHSQVVHGALIQGAREFVDHASAAGKELSYAASTIGTSTEAAISSIEKALEAASQLSANAASVGESLDRSSTRLESTLQQLADAVNVIPSLTGTLELAVNGLHESVKSLGNNQAEISRQLTAAVGEWRSAAQGLDSLTGSVSSVYTQIKSSLDALVYGADADRKSFLEEMLKLSEAIGKRIQELSELQQRMKSEIQAGFEAVAERQQTNVQEGISLLKQQVEQLKQAVAALSENTEAACSHITTAADAVHAAVQEIPVAELKDSVEYLPRKIVEAVRSTTAEIRKLTRETQPMQGDDGQVVEALNETNQILRQILEKQSKSSSKRRGGGDTKVDDKSKPGIFGKVLSRFRRK